MPQRVATQGRRPPPHQDWLPAQLAVLEGVRHSPRRRESAAMGWPAAAWVVLAAATAIALMVQAALAVLAAAAAAPAAPAEATAAAR